MLLAALAGGAAGIGVFFRMYWHRLLGVFSKKHRAQAEEARSSLASEEAETEEERTPEHTA